MNDRTLLVTTNENKILLGMKKRGFGQGKWNGYGGKVEAGETIEDAAIRELHEESGIKANTNELEKIGIFEFRFLSKPEWNQDVHVFGLKRNDDAIETEEMKPAWFPFEKIPYTEMWEDDKYWLPLVLEGKKVSARFTYTTPEKLGQVNYTIPFKKEIKL